MNWLKFAASVAPQTRFEGTDEDGWKFSARADLYIIRHAWENGCSFERLADGFGKGRGTHGDWSGIRDSSEEATRKMYRKARRYLQLGS